MRKIPLQRRTDSPTRALPPRRGYQGKYYAMYSSVTGRIVTDPRLMVVPVDDHGVHRGDGVFETFKCVDGRLYNLQAHLERLHSSAAAIALRPPWSEERLSDIVVQTVRAGGHRNSLVRLLLTRGPGSMGVDPYDCPEPALYVVVYVLKPSFMALHPRGASVVTCDVPVKSSFFANIKSTNYLNNALMKKAATDAGAHFAVGFDEAGHVTEGATENVGVVSRTGVLTVPRVERILPGTTMQRVLELARPLVLSGALRRIERKDITRRALGGAREILIFGTTPDVTAVVRIDGRPVGSGRPGRIAALLNGALHEDIRNNRALQTIVFPA